MEGGHDLFHSPGAFMARIVVSCQIPAPQQVRNAIVLFEHFCHKWRLFLRKKRWGKMRSRPTGKFEESHVDSKGSSGRTRNIGTVPDPVESFNMKSYVQKHLGKFSALLGILAVSGWLAAAVGAKDTSPPKVIVSDKAIERGGRFNASFSPVVKKVAPSVVNVYSTRTVRMRATPNPFFDFFGGQDPRSDRRQFKAEGTGSGVIVTEDGYILTNNHVVEDADKGGVKVALPNDRNEYVATVVGADPQTDIAVLKIDAKNLKPITLGDSDKLEVGDLVLAVGNPFNVGQSVTMGMVSALGRGFGILGGEGYEDFIQTDAPINPGNSGGALVDTEGRLVGISQSIVSGSGASAGVGFAVPINLARSVMDQLVTQGKVTRGFLGIKMQTLTPDLAEEFKVSAESGVVVDEVVPDSPGERAGIKEGDVITQVNGKKVTDMRHLRLMVSQMTPNSKVPLTLVRDGKEKSVNVTIGKLQDDPTVDSRRRGSDSYRNEPVGETMEGAEVADLDPRTRQQNKIPNNVQGAIVTRVEPDSPEDRAGLKPGDVIVEVGRKPVRNADEAVTQSKKFEDRRMLVRVWTNDERAGGTGGMHYVTVDNSKKKS
jgi:serine protease Do